MLQFSARGFFWLSQYLESLKVDCYILSVPVEPDTLVFNMMVPIDERLKAKATQALKHVEEQSRSIGLNITADTAADTRERIEGDYQLMNCQWLLDQTRGIQKLAEKELKERVFLYCPPEKAKFSRPELNRTHLGNWSRMPSRAQFTISMKPQCVLR